LRWGVTEFIYDAAELFITVHKGESECRAGVYLEGDGKFRLLTEIRRDGRLSYFIRPKVVRYKAVYLVQITEIFYGTANSVEEHIFVIDREGQLTEVDFTPAPDSFTPYLGAGEGIWKGEINNFTDDTLSFEFYIWNSDDANCCPRGGKVTGSYRLLPPDESSPEKGYRIIMDRYERHPVPE